MAMASTVVTCHPQEVMKAKLQTQCSGAARWHVPKVVREIGAASMAMAFTAVTFNPNDVVKTKLQTQCQLAGGRSSTPLLYKNARHCFRTILSEQGFVRGLWLPGLTAAILRDTINGGIRMGLYPTSVRVINDACSDGSLNAPSIGVKMLAGCATGAVGAIAGNPTDLIKVRLQAESGSVKNGVYVTGLFKDIVPAYRSATQAFVYIAKHDGVTGVFRGCPANVARAALITSAQMTAYDQTKIVLTDISQGSSSIAPLCAYEPARVASASFFSGVSAATVAAPADLVRSRIMGDCQAGKKKALYSGSMDCVLKTLRYEGVLALWKGWVPAYLRLGPQFMIGFPLMELFRTQLFGLPPF